MKIVAISDLHATQIPLPDGDVLAVVGDLIHLGTFAELKRQVAWLKSLPHTHKVLVAGNHDVCLENLMRQEMEDELRRFLHPIVYLRDSAVTLDGIRFYGSPWIPEYAGSFQLQPEELKSKWALIPECDVLLTHCPPRGICDPRGKGCEHLTESVLRQKPHAHFFGHCHEGAGEEIRNGIQFFNIAGNYREITL
ncbi:MAG: metallophosphoesterase [Candidatus Sulfotelmatobacter sp.]